MIHQTAVLVHIGRAAQREGRSHGETLIQHLMNFLGLFFESTIIGTAVEQFVLERRIDGCDVNDLDVVFKGNHSLHTCGGTAGQGQR